MFQYFVYGSRRVRDCLKSTGTCPYKTIYVRIFDTSRVSAQKPYSVKQFNHLVVAAEKI